MNEFIRFIPGKDGDAAAGKLQLSIVRYKERLPGQIFNPNFAVDLVSVIHIGDKQYYEKLQKRLEMYDSVIYEDVTKTDCIKNSRNFDDITSLDPQSIDDANRSEARHLSLTRQGDYLKRMSNWKHGDLDWSTFQYLEEERERHLAMTPLHDRISTSLQHFGYKFRSRPWPIIAPFLMPFIVYLACPCNDLVLSSVDTLEDILKYGIFSYFAAQKFWEAWSVSASCRSHKDYEDTSGLGKESVVIGKRNKVAIKELKTAIKRGEHSIAILYGAGHMPDFNQRLTEEFNLVPTSMDWITAWSVEKGPKSKYIQPFLNKFASDNRTLILASVIFATLISEILALQGNRYWNCLMLIRFTYFLLIKLK